MAKTDKKSAPKQTEQERSFIIRQVFLKQQSLEVHIAPYELKQEWNPDATMNLDVKSKSIDEKHYLVDLVIDVHVKIGTDNVFTTKITQSGIFEMSGYTVEQNDQLLNSFCANVLFPYARQAVSSITNQAGFPPLILAPVDFDSRYVQLRELQQQQESA